MVRLRAVRAYHPDPERGNASELVSPVYDTLSDEDHRRYGSRRFNAASFTSRPRGVPLSDFLRDAPRRLKEALNAGVYRQDPDPSLYIYGIRFRPEEEIQLELPASDRREEYLLLGLVGGLEISSDDPRDIALHEKVFPDRVEERIRLTDATGTSFAPILAGYTLPSHEVNDLLEEFLGINRRALEFTPRSLPSWRRPWGARSTCSGAWTMSPGRSGCSGSSPSAGSSSWTGITGTRRRWPAGARGRRASPSPCSWRGTTVP